MYTWLLWTEQDPGVVGLCGCDVPPCFVYVPSWESAVIGFRGGGLRFLALLRSLSDVGVVGTTIVLPNETPPSEVLLLTVAPSVALFNDSAPAVPA